MKAPTHKFYVRTLNASSFSNVMMNGSSFSNVMNGSTFSNVMNGPSFSNVMNGSSFFTPHSFSQSVHQGPHRVEDAQLRVDSLEVRCTTSYMHIDTPLKHQDVFTSLFLGSKKGWKNQDGVCTPPVRAVSFFIKSKNQTQFSKKSSSIYGKTVICSTKMCTRVHACSPTPSGAC